MKEQVKNHPSIQPYLRRMPSVSSANYMIAFRNAAVDYVKSQIPEDMSDYAEDIWNNVGRRSEVRAILSWFKEYIKKVSFITNSLFTIASLMLLLVVFCWPNCFFYCLNKSINLKLTRI